MKIINIKKNIRSTKRLTEIIKVLSRFGFQEVLVDIGLGNFTSHKKHDTDREDKEVDLQLSRPVRLRMVLEELGPTFIKLGQILATRPDLIPPEWADEFKRLQDNCSLVSFAEIEKVRSSSIF